MVTRRILILDDDASLARLYAKVLRNAGYDVQSTRTVSAARTALAEDRFDIFVCDMHIEDQNGLVFLAEQWERLQAGETEVVVLSGREQFRTDCESLGIKHFLTKPISMRELTEHINQMKLNAQP